MLHVSLHSAWHRFNDVFMPGDYVMGSPLTLSHPRTQSLPTIGGHSARADKLTPCVCVCVWMNCSLIGTISKCFIASRGDREFFFLLLELKIRPTVYHNDNTVHCIKGTTTVHI